MAFTASYEGVCDACGGPIKPGQLIRDSTEGQRGARSYEHVECPPPPAQPKACPVCFLIHNGACF